MSQSDECILNIMRKNSMWHCHTSCILSFSPGCVCVCVCVRVCACVCVCSLIPRPLPVFQCFSVQHWKTESGLRTRLCVCVCVCVCRSSRIHHLTRQCPLHGTLMLLAIELGASIMKWMSFSITWVLLVRMDGILSAEPFNVLYKWPQFYSVSKSSTSTLNTGGEWLAAYVSWSSFIALAIRCPNVSQFMSPGFTPTQWCTPRQDARAPIPTSLYYVRIAVTTISIFRFSFPFSVSI